MLLTTVDEATAEVRSGQTVAIGGSVNAGAPMALVRALLASPATDLTIVGSMTGTLAIDFLIAAGKVRRIVCPYLGNPEAAPIAPALRLAARSGALQIDETDEGVHLVALRAAAASLPFGVWKASLGTAVGELNPGVRQRSHPSGAYLEVDPLPIDVALLWAGRATSFGDAVWGRVSMSDRELGFAARRRILQVDQVIPVASLREEHGPVSVAFADGVVPAEGGTWPFAGMDRPLDVAFLQEYAACTSLAAMGAFVQEHIVERGHS